MEKNHLIKITIRIEPFSNEYHADIIFWDEIKYRASNEMKILLDEIKKTILEKQENKP
jgi:hypothetical protein